MVAKPRIAMRDLARMLRIPEWMALIMLPMCAAVGEPAFAAAFLAMAAASRIMSWLIGRSAGPPDRDYSTGETMATAAVAWLMIELLAAIPFWLAPWLAPADHDVQVFRSLLNGLFEAVSGITSTGLTMVAEPGDLPATLQFWRSFTEWVGGVGIALLMITLLNPRADGGDWFNAELGKKFAQDARSTARWIWQIYAVLTLVAIALFWVLGMPWWESLNHGLTGIATGGFSVTNDSIGAYDGVVQLGAILVMTLGAISFAGYREAWRQRNPWHLVQRGPVALLLLGIAGCSVLLWLARAEFETDGGLLAAVFQTTSAFATAGFSTVDLADWHSAPLAVLITAMLIGGASGATTGGIKTDRVLLIIRGIRWRIERLFGGDGARTVRVDGERLPIERARLRVEGAATLVAVWLLTLLIGCLLLAPVVGDRWTFTQVSFEVVSALNSVGLSTGITTADLPAAGKWLLMVLMWVGRLELMAALALLWMPLAGLLRPRRRATRPR